MIEIGTPGPSATVQDLGRFGYAALGVARSGAFDAAALRGANRLVGNAENSAGIECTFGGLYVRLTGAHTLALTGAPCAGAPDWGVAISLPAGAEFTLGAPPRGVRSYLAVRGGIDVARTLGSRATDLLSGLGPAPLRAGDRLPVGRATVGGVTTGSWAPPAPSPAHRVVLGPRADWFTAQALELLLREAWTVRADADRVGVRLDGARLERARPGELPSEPTVPGAVQVPPDGRPIVFGPDAPVTGGYPVIAVLTDLGALAQARPGDRLRFTTRSGG